ncbi:chloride channel protein 2-like [Gadus chalcogrammus]|uniref:chloride channel protein 2-like n=1 Tax=Gadus chalcogrammus TaxID=1042646 RepID=UPI0024C4D3F2|nr:chloride channel protein 2-like [Gadus chalcogrammus]
MAGMKYNIRVEDIMVREVRYITLSSSYRGLQEVVQTSQLKTLALVESQESMILLGSIERIQLQSLLSIQLGRQRRLDHLSQLAQDNGTQHHHHLSSLGSDSTPGSPCIDPHARITNANACQGVRFLVRAQQISTEESTSFSPAASGAQLPLKSAMKAMSAISETETPNSSQTISCTDHGKESLEGLAGPTPPTGRKPKLKRVRISMADATEVDDDMSTTEISEWEEQQLDDPVDFKNCKIDPAPFQLVERTSLHKTHTIFSLLGLDHAYVTSIGRLVGVVSLKELRKAIEGSVTVTGVKVRPPLASFRDSGNSTNVSDITDLHKLWVRHRGHSLPREPTPPEAEDQLDLPYEEIPVDFSDQSNIQFESSLGDVITPPSELVLQESPSFTEDQSEFTFECSPSHTEESELGCDYEPPSDTPEPDQLETPTDELSPSPPPNLDRIEISSESDGHDSSPSPSASPSSPPAADQTE